MRITDRVLQTGTLASIQENMEGMARAQEQIATGKKLTRASDDPTGAAAAMRARSALRALDQYRGAISFANQRSSLEEEVLNGLSDTLTRAKELAVSQAGANGTPATRAATRAEVDELLRHAVTLANTTFGDGYLFAAQGTAAAAYTVADTPAGLDWDGTHPGGTQEVAISAHQTIATNHNGVQVFEDSGALDALRDFSRALGSGDAAQMSAALGGLGQAFDAVQSLVGDTGARVNQLQITRDTMDTMEVQMKQFQSDVEDVDFEQAVTDLTGRQTALQAAMLAAGRLREFTLANYLR